MKKAGRRVGSAYELYGFIPRVENRKHTAICMSCNTVIQNTAVVRMQRHRKSCLDTRPFGANQAIFTDIQVKRIPKKSVAAQQNESINSAAQNLNTEQNSMEYDGKNPNDYNNTTYEEPLEHRVPVKNVTTQQNECTNFTVKTENIEQNSMEYDGTNPNGYVNESATYEEPLEETSSSRRVYRSAQNYEMNVNNVSHKSLEYHQRLNGEENPLKTPVSVQQQPSEPFETYSTTESLFRTPQIDIDSENDDIMNINDELDVIQNLMPRSKESKQLQDELCKAEAEYYRCKTAYFAKLNENCKIKQTLMLLESRKLQLEIERLSYES